jgi:ankyrin repeat protein
MLRSTVGDTSDVVNVNQTRWSGWAPIHRAAEQGRIDIIELLLDYGAKIDSKTVWGWHSPLHLALGNGWKDCAWYLVERGAVSDYFFLNRLNIFR